MGGGRRQTIVISDKQKAHMQSDQYIARKGLYIIESGKARIVLNHPKHGKRVVSDIARYDVFGGSGILK